MKIKKVFNNNVVYVIDEDYKEFILMGKGIGFNKYPKEEVDATLVEKRFTVDSKESFGKLSDLFAQIPEDDIQLADEIILYGEAQLGQHFNHNLLITLSDHISFMLNRAKEASFFKNPLEWEIKQIYPKEYEVSLTALQLIEKKTGIMMDESEASFIALHFANANLEAGGMDETIMFTKIMGKILDIVTYHYGIKIDESKFNYMRFITHLRFFIKRQLSGEKLETNSSLLEIISKKHPKDYECALRIKRFLEEQYQWEVSEDELLYLTLHLYRVTSRNKVE
ncbi:BglG family transcription antiterminator LicT [Carnobacterium maltaromaticum]|uniref:BglG family transcription antiterminator LicT n=1 Tax=Carnobacterium maltaromaticum TaxID=2751 RepID=UPI00295E9EAC|nr:PRD domain-containing protein [Carnobacterium maltaromaticum]